MYGPCQQAFEIYRLCFWWYKLEFDKTYGLGLL